MLPEILSAAKQTGLLNRLIASMPFLGYAYVQEVPIYGK